MSVVAAAVGGVAAGAVGVGGGLLMRSMGGGGGGGGGGGVPIATLERIAKENAKKIQASAFGTVYRGDLKKRDGQWVVLGKDKKVLFKSKDKAEAQKFIDKRKGKPKSAPPLVPEITKLSNQFVKQVDRLIASGNKQLNAEQKRLLDRIKAHDKRLNTLQNKEDKSLLADLKKITADFNQGMSLLDAQDRAEFSEALEDFERKADTVTAEFDARSSAVVEEGDAESIEAIEDFEADSLNIGDDFVRKTDAALGNFESFISLDNASETLNTLSQSIFDTRQRLIAEADPRAAELSAIADNNAAAMMSGQISADVQANLARSSAMRALSGGFGAGSEMGRGLAARDLGLTSLDLMQQGTKMYDDQRRLNYDTRVAGVENTALGMFGEMRSGQESLMRSTIDTAQSDRNQRQGIFDTVLNRNMERIDTRVGRDLGIAGSVFQSGLETNRLGFDARRDNISERTQRNNNRLTNVFDRDGLARRGIYDSRIATGRSIYATNANVAGNIFDTRANAIYQNTGARIGARDKSMGNKIAVRTGVFDAVNAANQSATATIADATMKNWASRDAWNASNVSSNQAIWGNAINTLSSTAGQLASSYFSRPQSTPYGFGNFDYGSGTGA